MARADFQAVGKHFGEVVALSDFSLSVGDGELIAVLGPSGCGKSTLLRLTAGLEALTEGRIEVGGRRIDALPPHQRDVAMVFQSYALYPHMTVRGNIEFPLRMQKVEAVGRRRRTEEVASLLEIDRLLDRKPGQLSGGQRQRVALARALVRQPALFLLDEPLSNLDARLRTSVRQYIREVQRRLRVTTLYVTHDQTEAMTLGDRIVVLNQGRIQQAETPLTLYERPANVFVAGFIGMPPMNLLPADYSAGVVRIGNQNAPLPSRWRQRLGDASRGLTIGVRPESFAATGEGLSAVLDAGTREALGSETLVRAKLGPHEVAVRLFGSVRDLPATVTAPAEALHLFDATSGKRLEVSP
jgi:ABC-type sugar transport system ATPase subunit